MRKFLLWPLAFLGGMLVLLLIVGAAVVLLVYRGKGPAVAERTIVELTFDHGLVEYLPENPLSRALQVQIPTVRDVVEGIGKAAGDERVVALIVRTGGADLGLAQIQEVRDAILAFRKAGKPAVAFAEAFGEFGPGNGPYYLATACDEIYMQPSGDVGLTGLIAETPFARGTLDKLGVVPRLDHREEYKSAMNTFTERGYTAPHREATLKVMESQFDQIVSGIAAARKLPPEGVRALADRGPFLGARALEARLIDALVYRDEVETKVKGRTRQDAKVLDLLKYAERAGGLYEQGETIALIYGVGAVQRGKEEYSPLTGGSTMGADTVAAAFRAAVEDKDVKAILFRVDSPGGSYVASDTIWRETLRAREAGKPVIASMGNVAGSGGYFVAMAADKIVAQPGTITGSIGVFAGKLVTAGFWNKVGLVWDEVHTSDNATLWSGTRDYTPKQWAQLQETLDHIYDDFTTKAAAGRRLPKEKVLEVAKGRIWTGEDAKAIGLVDELGGFPVALRLAKAAAGIAPDAPVELRVFPHRRISLRELLMERLLEHTDDEEAVGAVVTRLLHTMQPLIRLARDVGLGQTPDVLTMPAVPVAR